MKKHIEQAFIQIRELHETLANPEKAKGAGAYMKNLFVFFGCDTKERRKHTKSIIIESNLTLEEAKELVAYLWKQKEREYHYAGIEWMMHYKKKWDIDCIQLFEFMIVHHSWWDSVDYIASKLVGEYFKRYPQQVTTVTARWNKGANMWLQRVSIIFQLTYKDKTDADLLFNYILHHKDSKEFFIRKAMGWALRQYARTDAHAVREFVKLNKLPGLTVREALKHIG